MILIVFVVIFVELFLSFFGFGIQVLFVSWGVMVNDGLFMILFGYWWCLFFLVFFIFLMMYVFNVFGDGLQDVFDFKLRRQLYGKSFVSLKFVCFFYDLWWYGLGGQRGQF